jgi:hypothetical protein
MQKWIDFKKKRSKYNRILQDLKKIIQSLQKYGQKGHLVKSLFDVIKKLFYDKSWLFSKESTWHRSPWAKMGGNAPKMAFFGQKLTSIVDVECNNFILSCTRTL